MPPGQLLLLTGSPGCGKTTIAPLVADHAQLSVCLDLDWFFAKLRSGALEPWRDEAHQQNRVVLSAAASAVATFTAGGYFTVADGILYPFMLDLFEAACEPLAITLNYVGNVGRHQVIPVPFNQPNIASPSAPTLAGGAYQQNYSYGYNDGQLVVVYDRSGRIMDPGFIDQRADLAGRYLARARALRAAALGGQRQPVAVANWTQRRSQIYADDRNTAAAAGYWVANLRAGFEQQTTHWRFSEFASLDNLTNRAYVGSVIVNDANSRFFEPEPGRTAYVMFNAALRN